MNTNFLSKIEFPNLYTPRLRLESIHSNYINDIYEIFSNANVIKYYNIDSFTSNEDAKNLIDIFNRRWEAKSGIRWGLYHEHKLIGTIGFNKFINDGHSAEIGFELLPKYWGNGYMNEALNKIIDFGFNDLELTELIGYVLPLNISSQNCLNRVGFVRLEVPTKMIFNNQEIIYYKFLIKRSQLVK